MDKQSNHNLVEAGLACARDIEIVIETLRRCGDAHRAYYEMLSDIDDMRAKQDDFGAYVDSFNWSGSGPVPAIPFMRKYYQSQQDLIKKINEKRAEERQAFNLLRNAIREAGEMVSGLPLDERQLLVEYFVWNETYEQIAKNHELTRNEIVRKIDGVIFRLARNRMIAAGGGE